MNPRMLAGAVFVLALAAGAAAWWAFPGREEATQVPAARPPNVLIVVWDTVRADRMSVYGHDAPTTPFLERFAAEARVFDNAISPATWTVPAHTSLFTGLPVASHGADVGWRWVDGHHVTLPEHLEAHGYRTFSFSANPYLGPQTNLMEGFQTRRTVWQTDRDATAELSRDKLIPEDASTEISPSFAGEKIKPAWKHPPFKDAAPLASQHLLDWLRVKDDRPWFAFMNLMEAHSPRTPTMASRRLMMDEEQIALSLQTDMSVNAQISAILGKNTYSREQILAMRGVYDATLRELDEAFAALITELDARGVLDDTIVVLTSDHGESLGEHGLFEHRWGIWQTLVHVPLIVRYPRGMPAGRVAEPVSTMAVYSTVFDLAGLPAPDVKDLPRSLTRAPRGPVFSELTDPFARKLLPFRRLWPELDVTPWLRTYDAIVDGAVKGVSDSEGGFSVFDLAHDPDELHDVVAAHPSAASLRTALKNWRARVPKADPSLRTEIDLRKGRKTDAATEEMLEVLGYAEEDPP